MIQRWCTLTEMDDLEEIGDIDPEYLRQHQTSASPTAVADLLKQITGSSMRSHLNDNQRCALAWSEANGDRERDHTTGVFLAPSRVKGADPRLIVYVDNNSCITDFSTNSDIYLARLANWGLALSGIAFRLGHSKRKKISSNSSTTIPKLPPLTEKEHAYITKMVKNLPPELKEKARYAIELSIRRTKG